MTVAISRLLLMWLAALSANERIASICAQGPKADPVARRASSSFSSVNCDAAFSLLFALAVSVVPPGGAALRKRG